MVSEHELEFRHAHFSSTHHLPPCNRNSTCNMSPVLTELLILFLSMVNAQAIGHANDIEKYVLKYVVEFDQGNRVLASTDTRTRFIKIGSEILHNTKITGSTINEEKALKQKRTRLYLSIVTSPRWKILSLCLVCLKLLKT